MPKARFETHGIKKIFNNQLAYDRFAFARRRSIAEGAPSRMQLFKTISDTLLPGLIEWHDWTKRIVQAGCENQITCLCGCSGSAKTFNVAAFASIWWLSEPEESSVMFISTTSISLRKRGWSEIAKMHGMVGSVGNFVDSKMLWQFTRGDSRHCIFGKAVEEGTLTRVADDLKGIHTRRQMIVIDEATAVPPAIYDAISNLYSYPEEFVLFMMANPRSRLDQFGRMIEPDGGWTSVSVDSEEWEGKPQPEYGGIIPRVLRFDAEKSPNIVEGRIVSRHLPMPEKVLAQRNTAGGQTPLWWSNFRGFPPPEGLLKTVFTENGIINHGGFGKFTFTGKDFTIIGFFDHARTGGDRPALRFGKLGEIEPGKMGLEWMRPIILGVDAASKVPVDYQLAEKVRRHCESIEIGGISYQCYPENLGVDGTGSGSGFVDILHRLWSPSIMRIVFGAAASEDATSPEDPRPACEVYENKGVEMWFRALEALNHGQLRGIDKDTAQELCTREFDDRGKRIKLQKKDDYCAIYGKSPDLGDCGIGLVEVARRKNFSLVSLGATANKLNDWTESVQKAQAVFDAKDAFLPEEEGEPDEIFI